MSDFEELMAQLKQKRDELKVQMHLATKELHDQWDELEEKMDDFTEKAQLEETGEAIGEAVSQLGAELKQGYERIMAAVKKND